MRTTSTAPSQRATNPAVELARYTITAGERVIQGQRVLGAVRLVDLPANGHGRRYGIGPGLAGVAGLEGIVEDFLGQAPRWQVIPAAGPCYLADRPGEVLP